MMKVLSRLLCLVLCVPLLVMGQEKIVWEKDGSEMVLIPAGSFEMGDHFNEGSDRERPVHTVTLDAFYMDTTEVTNAQHQVFLEQTRYAWQSRLPNRNNPALNHPNQPVVGVDWGDAMDYAAWAGKRLPTEAEWEYAARGGLAGKQYPWGDGKPSAEKANYGKSRWDASKTSEVGSYPANGYGLYDMAGNVWEWCLDEWDSDYYSNSPVMNPLAGNESIEILTYNYENLGLNRVLRGGAWNTSAGLRVSERSDFFQGGNSSTYGFRCVSKTPRAEKDNTQMALIPAGTFEMGDSKNEPEDRMKESRPVHTVELDAFYMGRHEVTVGQFKKFLRQTGHNYQYSAYGDWWGEEDFPSLDHPMVRVSWNDAMAYAKWAGKRLPTEAEWEYAARGGLSGKRYPWGDEEPSGKECNFADINADVGWANMDVDDGHAITAPARSFQPNGYGLYDMAGNVREWCADAYDKNYYSISPAKNPKGPDTGGWRVLRGGSWSTTSLFLRVAFRNVSDPTMRPDSVVKEVKMPLIIITLIIQIRTKLYDITGHII